MAKSFKIVGEDMSDGYHTFDELYEHRCLLFINLCLMAHGSCSWKPHYDGWDCLYWESPAGQVSYHVPTYFRELYERRIQRADDYAFDGHDSQQVINRLRKTALAFQAISSDQGSQE